MRRQLAIPATLAALLSVLVATTSFAGDKPIDPGHRHGSPTGANTSPKTFSGVRWQPSPSEPRVAHAAEAQWTVTARAVDRSGNPAEGVSYSVYDLDTAAQVAIGRTGPDTSVRLPTGRYGVTAMVTTPDTTGTSAARTMVILPEVAVTADTTVVFDARLGRRVSTTLDEPQAEQVSAAVLVYQRARNGKTIKYGLGAQTFAEAVYVTPTASRADLTTFVHTTWTRPDRPDVYNLIGRSAGRVPEQPSYRFRTADLAAVHVRYPVQGVAACGGTYIGPYLAGERAPLAYGTSFALPTRRIEYYSPEDARDVAWYTEFAQTTADCSFDSYDVHTGTPARYPRAGQYTASWNTAPFAPSTALDADGRPAAVRQGDTMSIGIAMYADSQPGHTDFGGPYAGTTGTVQLFQGERLIGSSDTLERLTCQVPSEPGDYRLTASTERAVGWSTLSTRTETTWTFRSAPHRNDPQPLPLPLLNVRYQAVLDDHNRAPADSPVDLSVHIEHPAPIARVQLAVSYDEGDTWHDAPLARSGARWRTKLRQRTGESVSLRLKASDNAGNGVEQTLIRAYLLG